MHLSAVRQERRHAKRVHTDGRANLRSVPLGCSCDLAADRSHLRRFPCGETSKGRPSTATRRKPTARGGLRLSACSALADSSKFKSRNEVQGHGTFSQHDSVGRIASSSPALGERPTYGGGRDQGRRPGIGEDLCGRQLRDHFAPRILRHRVRRPYRPRAPHGGGSERRGLRQHLERHLLRQRHASARGISGRIAGHKRRWPS